MNLSGHQHRDAYDKLSYIDSVCATLIDSRFGIGRSNVMFRNADRYFEIEPAAFFDNIEDGIQPSDVLRRQYRRERAMSAGRRHSEDHLQLQSGQLTQIMPTPRSNTPATSTTARPPPI